MRRGINNRTITVTLLPAGRSEGCAKELNQSEHHDRLARGLRVDFTYEATNTFQVDFNLRQRGS